MQKTKESRVSAMVPRRCKDDWRKAARDAETSLAKWAMSGVQACYRRWDPDGFGQMLDWSPGAAERKADALKDDDYRDRSQVTRRKSVNLGTFNPLFTALHYVMLHNLARGQKVRGESHAGPRPKVRTFGRTLEIVLRIHRRSGAVGEELVKPRGTVQPSEAATPLAARVPTVAGLLDGPGRPVLLDPMFLVGAGHEFIWGDRGDPCRRLFELCQRGDDGWSGLLTTAGLARVWGITDADPGAHRWVRDKARGWLRECPLRIIPLQVGDFAAAFGPHSPLAAAGEKIKAGEAAAALDLMAAERHLRSEGVWKPLAVAAVGSGYARFASPGRFEIHFGPRPGSGARII